MILEKLDRLKKLKDWHPETKELLDSWEQQIKDLELSNSFLEQPQCIELNKRLKSLIKSTKEKLFDRNLTELQRQYNFALLDLLEIIILTFSLENNNKNLQSINDEIEAELNTYDKS